MIERNERVLSTFVLAAALTGGGVAVAVLLGWALGLSGVPTFLSGADAMVPWTAIGCLLAAAWVLIWGPRSLGSGTKIALLALAVGVLAVGLVAALENLADIDLGLDSRLWPSSTGELIQLHPGRPSLQTAIVLIVLGAAELAIVIQPGRRTIDAAGLVACGVTGMGLLGLTGRALQITPAFTSAQLGSGGLSVPTATGLTLIGAALAVAALGPQLLYLASRSAAARRQLQILLPAAFVIPLLVFLGAYATLILSGPAQVTGVIVAALAIIALVMVLRLVSVGVSEDVASHAAVEQALNRRNALYAAVVESSDDAILSKDLDGTISGWNRAAERLYGYTAEEAIGQNVELIVPDERRDEMRGILRRLAAGERIAHIETVRQRRDGHRFPASLTISPVVGAAGEVVGASSITRDVTVRRKAESLLAERTDELRQAQKMEAVGRLAGGVAHDFNNLLTVIISAAELLEMRGEAEAGDQELLDEISDAAQQAAALTAQLLAFGRRSPASVDVLDLGRLLTDSTGMLGRMIGSDIKLELRLSDEKCLAKADRNQFQQVIMNLVVNARDAMPTGGTLTVATAVVELREPPPGNGEVVPGPFVRIDVTDTGTGMGPEQTRRIFEPFYTTKELGKGTGLGLSTSHGIVSQLGGDISVRSEPGQGTTFSILLPRAEAERRSSEDRQHLSPTRAVERRSCSPTTRTRSGALRSACSRAPATRSFRRKAGSTRSRSRAPTRGGSTCCSPIWSCPR